MQLREYIEKRRSLLTDFKNRYIEKHGQRPDRYPLDMDEDQWDGLFIVYEVKQRKL